MDDELEVLYWRFDAMHRGYGAWEGRPTSERDAFKRTVKQALAEKDGEIELRNEMIKAMTFDCIEKDKAYQQLMAQAVRFASLVEDEAWIVGSDERAAREFLESPAAQAFLKEREGT